MNPIIPTTHSTDSETPLKHPQNISPFGGTIKLGYNGFNVKGNTIAVGATRSHRGRCLPPFIPSAHSADNEAPLKQAPNIRPFMDAVQLEDNGFKTQGSTIMASTNIHIGATA